ncbi:hypothetical protein SAMN05421693_101147 [Ectothiorhodospira magna]|uniref:Penicillin-binding protein activator n=1 Tax=Ectothiorhodospira magna TaxID=867345 RepID=A0A1H8Z4J4_9GAMM|nr:penicillin-binding protein activator [Ectothiorhodospira magna]SEP58518.1 hypothetical protein SAMN05421693_101147 [Ectothiorhodospira magna]
MTCSVYMIHPRHHTWRRKLGAGVLGLVLMALSVPGLAEFSLASSMLTDQDRLRAAQAALERQDPLTALGYLPADSGHLAPSMALQSLYLRAQAEMALGRTLDAISTWNRLHGQMPDAQSRSRIRQQLMAWLEGFDPADLRSLRSRASHPDTVQWLDQALLARTPASGHLSHERTASHPATLASGPPRQIAVILPLTGRYGGVSRNILQGIRAAHESGGPGPAPILMVYDMGETPAGVLRRYDEAVADGAELVIGPLSRAAVDLLAGRAAGLPVPVLTLNHGENRGRYPEQLFRYSLNPEHEAIQVATRAFAQGHRQAVVLVPRTELGERLQGAFAARFEALGGTVRLVRRFPPQGMNPAEVLGQWPQNVDMVFLSGEPGHARMLVPGLQRHRTGALPVYATSHIFSGRQNPALDRDLDGVFVADMPWLLFQTDSRAGLDQVSLDAGLYHWPRMAAFGFDAYQLGLRLGTLQQGGGERLYGLTGTLTIDNQGYVRRLPEWGQFAQGRPRVIADWRH